MPARGRGDQGDGGERTRALGLSAPGRQGRRERRSAALAESAPAAPSAVAPDAAGAPDLRPGHAGADGYTYWFVGGTQAEADAQQAWYKQYTVPNSCKSAFAAPPPGPCSSPGATGKLTRAPTAIGPAAPACTATAEGAAIRAWLRRVEWDDVDQGEGVKNMIEEIRQDVDTFCNPFNDSGATYPGDMVDGIDYINGRSGVNVRTWYLPAGFSLTGYDGDTVRNVASNIPERRGHAAPDGDRHRWFSHYPLAYGYRTKTQRTCTTTFSCPPGGCKGHHLHDPVSQGFYVNQGWGDAAGEWVSTDIFFNGRLSPQVPGANDVGLYRRENGDWFFDVEHDGTQDWFKDDYNGDLLSIGGIPS